MKKFKTISLLSLLVFTFAFIIFGLNGSSIALAATTPSLGSASTYGILASTYTNTSAGTTINGDIGFTTPPAVTPSGTHINYGPGAPYAVAGTDQGAALSSLASQACTFSFGGGAINLSTDTTHGSIGVYTPGVYCSAGAMDVSGPITLSGSGTYIFRSGGALTSTVGAIVTLSGASACDVFWTPAAATTLAANTTFAGTVISDAGITVGANTVWAGRALSFGGTTTSDTDIITVPSCTIAAVVVPPVVVITPVAPTSTPVIVSAPVVPTSTPVVVAPVVIVPVTPLVTAVPALISAPSFPATGIAPAENNFSSNLMILFGALIAISTSLLFVLKKHKI